MVDVEMQHTVTVMEAVMRQRRLSTRRPWGVLQCSAGDDGGCCNASLATMGVATQHTTAMEGTTMQRGDAAMQRRQRWVKRRRADGDGGCDAARGGHAGSS